MEMPVLKIGLQARNGWTSDIPTFVETPKTTILAALIAFLPDASPEQVQAWEQSIALLQEALGAATRSLPSIAAGSLSWNMSSPWRRAARMSCSCCLAARWLSSSRARPPPGMPTLERAQRVEHAGDGGVNRLARGRGGA